MQTLVHVFYNLTGNYYFSLTLWVSAAHSIEENGTLLHIAEKNAALVNKCKTTALNMACTAYFKVGTKICQNVCKICIEDKEIFSQMAH